MQYEYETYTLNNDGKLTYGQYLEAICYIGDYDYYSIKDKQINVEKVGKGIVILAASISLLTPLAPYGAVTLAYVGLLEVGSAVVGIDPITGRQLSYSERVSRSVTGALMFASGVGTIAQIQSTPTEQLHDWAVSSNTNWGNAHKLDTQKGMNLSDKNLTIHAGQQGKHIVGHNNYIEGRSVLYGTEQDAQKLIDQYAGTGTSVSQGTKEVVDCGKVIGKWIGIDGQMAETTRFTIHYSKDGVHIIPARPYS